MSTEPEPLPDAPPAAPALPAPPLEAQLTDLAPSITVITPEDERVEVAASATAARIKAQITVSRLHQLVDRTAKAWMNSNKVVSATELSRLVGAAHTLAEMTTMVYEGKKLPKELADTSAIERFAIAALQAATKGAAQGASAPKSERMKRVRELGRTKRDEAPVIDIEAPR